jgi:SAM-dependent methyltransferase
MESRPYQLCPLCGNKSHFTPFGLTPRANAQCSICGSLERHRIAWLFLRRMTDLFAPLPRVMLHVAAEKCLSKHLSKLPHLRYLPIDIKSTAAELRIDITKMPYQNGSIDVTFCSHVLEHIDDDRKAMSEVRRTLSPRGWAVFIVPITASRTMEDPSIRDPKQRTQIFGQWDHVRRYGPDFEGRLRESGFRVQCFSRQTVAHPHEAETMALRDDKIFLCIREGSIR